MGGQATGAHVTSTARDALVAPFVGERYADRAALSSLIAPPYDVLPPSRREELARRSPHNIVHFILPDAGAPDPYTHAASLLDAWRRSGVIVQEEREAVYVVQQAFRGPAGDILTRTGMIGAVLAEPFSLGRVRPHERTHAGPKADRLALLRAAQATFEALLFLTHDPEGRLADALAGRVSKRPLAEARLEGVTVRLWRVTGQPALRLARLAGRDPLYIADGHHRYETAVAYRAENERAARLPGLIVPLGDPGLVVLATHRIVRGQATEEGRLLQALGARFHIRRLPSTANYVEELGRLAGRGTAAVIVLPKGKALAVLLKSGVHAGDLPFANEPTVASLDVARVDEWVVTHLVALAGRAAGVDYSADAGQVINDVEEGRASAGVLLNPTPIEAVLAVADAGAVMPPKATYFVPKVPSGLVGMRYQ